MTQRYYCEILCKEHETLCARGIAHHQAQGRGVKQPVRRHRLIQVQGVEPSARVILPPLEERDAHVAQADP